MRRTRRRDWSGKLFVGALLWLVSKVLEPVPLLRNLFDVVAFVV